MTYVLGSGWWLLWYGLLWLAAAPFVALAVALARSRGSQPSPAMDVAFGLASVGLFVLATATLVSAILWTAAGATGSPTLWKFVRNVLLAAACALVLGLGGFAMAFYATSHTYPMASRWGALLMCLAAIGGMLWFCLHAAWRWRLHGG